MTGAMWFGTPPEVHSALLHAGPGAGPLTASADTWRALAAEYHNAAEELNAILVTVEASVWSGPSAQRCVTAHQRYLGWLREAAAVSAARASQLDDVATAYTTALLDMPTLAELALNHATHATLLGTNFFGINTIPIALNEADYSRMWLQAATAMSVYDGVAGMVRAASSRLPPPPAILTTELAAVAKRTQTPAVEAGSSLSASESTLSALIEGLIKILVPAPLFQVVEELNRLNMTQLLTMLLVNPTSAVTVLGPLVSAVLGLVGYISISLLLFALQIGSTLLLLAPGIVLPLAFALSDADPSTSPPAPLVADRPSAPATAIGGAVDQHTASSITLSNNAVPTSSATSTSGDSTPSGNTAGISGTAPTGSLLYAVGVGGSTPPGNSSRDRESAAEGTAAAASAPTIDAVVQSSLSHRSPRRRLARESRSQTTGSTSVGEHGMATMGDFVSRSQVSGRGYVNLSSESAGEPMSAPVLLPESWTRRPGDMTASVTDDLDAHR